MNKLKYIKLENSNGTFTSPIPISADATNVDMTSGNSVQTEIGDIDYANKGSIATQLGSKLEVSNIIAGSNITLATSGNNITISSSGGGGGSTNDGVPTNGVIGFDGLASEIPGGYEVTTDPFPGSGGSSDVNIFYDTVALMKADTNLSAGKIVGTLGYYAANDGGGAIYKITDIASQTEYQETVGNLYATLIIDGVVYPEMFGAYGDGTHDDTDAINNAINSGASTIKFYKDKTYMVTPYDTDTDYRIMIPSNTEVDLSGATIKAITNGESHYKIIAFKDVSNSSLKNGYIIGDVDTHTDTTGEWGYGVAIRHCYNIILQNLNISKCWGDGININFLTTTDTESSNILIENCICDDNRRQGMSIEAGSNITVVNSQFINTGLTAHTSPSAGVDIEPAINGMILSNITFTNCIFKGNYGMQFVGGGSSNDNITVSNVTLDKCILDNTGSSSTWCAWIQHIFDAKVMNCIIGNSGDFIIQPSNDFIFDNNNVQVKLINVRTQSCQNSIISFTNNNFKTAFNLKSSLGFLENYDTNPVTDRNNTILIKNNTFKGETSGDYVYDVGLINILKKQGIDKAIICNNYIEGGQKGINVSCSSIIKNNTICGQTSYGIGLYNPEISDIDVYHDIEENNFQNCGSNASIIYNLYQKNIVLKNNTYYPIYFNNGIGSTDYPKTKFLYIAASGYSIDRDNDIVTSS